MELQLDPDRLLPVDPGTRALARSLYDRVAATADHLAARSRGPSLLRDDAPFSDPTDLLITYDHYVTRLLHAAGVDLAELGAGTAAEADPRAVWRLFCENWHLTTARPRGTGSLTSSSRSSGSPPSRRPRSLMRSTTRSPGGWRWTTSARAPCSSASASRCWRRPTTRWTISRCMPPWRPIRHSPVGCSRPSARMLTSTRPLRHSRGNIERLTGTAGAAPDDFDGYLEALRERRAHFIRHGAVSADHGVREPLPSIWIAPRPQGSTEARRRHARAATKPTRSALTCCSRWPA